MEKTLKKLKRLRRTVTRDEIIRKMLWNKIKDLQYPLRKRDVDTRLHKKCCQKSIFYTSEDILKGTKIDRK